MNTTIKSGAGVSRYLRLYRVLSQALAEGRFAAGEPLPSEPRLMRDYGVSRSTVRRALAGLEAEGRIDRERGRGTFAREQKQRAVASRDWSAVLDGTADTTVAVSSQTTAFERVPTPAFLPREDHGFGSTTLLVRRIRSVAREPVALETAYLPEEIAAGLTRRQVSADGVPILALLTSLGHRSASVEREFAALEADPLAAGSLDLAVGVPVFNVRTLAHDLRHRIIAYVDCLYRPDRYEARAAIEIAASQPRRATAKRN